MHIVNVTPGNLPIPPNGWGAVEKIIWSVHTKLLANGHDSEIKYLNDLTGKEDVVHIHMANLANEAHDRGIPYYFTCHDHHSFCNGKTSTVYLENLKAMKNAKRAFVSARYLVKYFEDVPFYFSHGVDTTYFKPPTFDIGGHKLLCVANNGLFNNPTVDRKGFLESVEIARMLNLPITIAGPENNKKFFASNPIDYPKLSILYDLSEVELLKLYQTHTVFLHMSNLEAGHPNMTLLEAMSCGLPVVGTLEAGHALHGMEVVGRSVTEGVEGVNKIIKDYSTYVDNATRTAQRLDWGNRVDELVRLYFMDQPFSKRLMDQYLSTKILRIPKHDNGNNIQVSFNDGPRVEISGYENTTYDVSFTDVRENRVVYSSTLKNGCWASALPKYHKDWRIDVVSNGNKIKTVTNNLTNKNVRIVLDTIALGDTIAWVPYVEEFKKKHGCNVTCQLSFHELFTPLYSEIKMSPLSTDVGSDFFATYRIGYFHKDNWSHLTPVNAKTTRLQKVASDILGLNFSEIRPRIVVKNSIRPIKDPYVCIAVQSTAQCKYWNNKTGWDSVVNYLKSLGYKVVCIDRDKSFGVKDCMNTIPKGVEDRTGNYDLQDRITYLTNCDLFIGLSSGLTWLAWALGTNVVTISGFNGPDSDFLSNNRVFNGNVCNSCWNDSSVTFDSGDWKWCPRNKNFECSREITFAMVKEKIDMSIALKSSTYRSYYGTKTNHTEVY